MIFEELNRAWDLWFTNPSANRQGVPFERRPDGGAPGEGGG
jgi:hypothetical protein